MEAKELRIGNYVNVPNEKQCPFRIDLFDYVSKGIGKFGQISNENTHPLTWYLQDLKPIELTEEWILKFGFKQFKKYYIYNLGEFQIDKAPKECGELYWFFIGNNNEETPYCVEIKYVHKLQNLYFALTGEELEIN